MAKKRKGKHKPQRTCVGCHTVSTKRSMTRLVRTSDGIVVDTSGKMPGRGAYLHNSIACWEAGMKSSLSRALKTELTPEDIERLKVYITSLLEEESDDRETDTK